MLRRYSLFLLLTMLSVPLIAQDKDRKNEFGFTIGTEVVPDGSIGGAKHEFSSSVAFGFNYARRIHTGNMAAVHLEVPISAAPSHSVRPVSSLSATSQATLFVTPSFRVGFLPQRRFQPWLSFGGGYALFEGSELLASGAKNPARLQNRGALQWGGGLDVPTSLRLWKPIAFRFEVRDFYSPGGSDLNVAISDDQHSVNIKGGLTWRW